MRYLLMASLLLLPACGGDDDDDDDVLAIDAASVIDGAAAIDGPMSSIDSAPGVDGAAPDGAAPDADACGTIGMPCTKDGMECDEGQRCEFSVGGDFCTKNRDGCLGFSDPMCMDPNAPHCHAMPSSSAGLCLSEMERDCICERSPSSILGCP